MLNTISSIRNYFHQYLAEFLTALGAIGLTLLDIMSENEEWFLGEYSWKEAFAQLLALFGLVLLVAIVISAIRNLSLFNKKLLKIEL